MAHVSRASVGEIVTSKPPKKKRAQTPYVTRRASILQHRTKVVTARIKAAQLLEAVQQRAIDDFGIPEAVVRLVATTPEKGEQLIEQYLEQLDKERESKKQLLTRMNKNHSVPKVFPVR
jgi:uncharacterized protein YigA (DUF484 family)